MSEWIGFVGIVWACAVILLWALLYSAGKREHRQM